MKIFCYTVLLVAVAMVSGNKAQYYDVKDAPELFEKFVRDFNKEYKSEADRMEHYEAFVNSLHEINKSNAESTSATFGINQFADYTPSELANMRGVFPSEFNLLFIYKYINNLPLN